MVAREDHHEKIYATMLCKRLTYLELRFVSSATRGRGGGGKKGKERNESAPDRMAGLRWPVAWLNASGGQIIIMVEEQAVCATATGPWPASWNMQRPKAKYYCR